ncbi:MAG TPA: alkaline phytoceramidase [Methylomirabilota bacterium]|nr:alkaline phytoceramidase [Methylomirabilota bacterium]
MSPPARVGGWRVGLLVAIALAAVGGVTVVPPIRQDLAYHHFADQRAILFVPHGLNVLSNVGFLLAGAWALVRVARAALPGWERVAGLVFATGLILTGLGSAWYHAAPGNATLVWDRLPLSALFPTVFAVVIGDRVSPAASRVLLAPLALGAVASVVWWQQTDDLRPYALAQFLPMLLIPLMLALLPGHRPAGFLLAGIALYAVGKGAEVADRGVFLLGGLVSGHTLKHLLAAAAAALIVRWLVGPAALLDRSPPTVATAPTRRL